MTCTCTSSRISPSAASTTSVLHIASPSSDSRASCSSRTTCRRLSAPPSCARRCPPSTLNAGVGGLNAQAVEIAAREGARIVWLPTVDSENEASEDGPKPAKPPVWRKISDELVEAGVGTGPVRLTDDALASVYAVVARHDIVLATGHLGRAEIHAVVEGALAAGVKHVVVTHPDYPTQGVPIDEQRELAGRGAVLERCFAPIHSGKVSWEQTFEAIRATGPQHNVLSTDLGQTQNPPVEDGLALMADRLLEAGFSEDDVRTMAVTNTRLLAGV
jgi:hypothetical protein